MDFASFQKGILELLIGTAAALNITLTTQPSASPQVSIKSPLIESYNLPSEANTAELVVFQDLNSVTKNDEVNLKMVVKEPEISENNFLVTVEEPAKVFTVLEPLKTESAPSAKPSLKPSETPVAKQLKEKPVEIKTEVIQSPGPSVIVATQSTPNGEAMFKMANEHRAKLGKNAFEKDDRLCKIAESRAPQVDGELSNGTLHKGFKALKLPYWATENIAAYKAIEENFKFWISDYIHRIAIEGDHKYSCVECAGSSCSQIFSSFVPK